ncbi:DUF1801 domain-containing protein [soil metagenome]
MAEKFTAEERAAMKERAKELKATHTRAENKADLLARIAEMSEPSRSLATRVHELVTAGAPGLEPKTWYGQPAYALDGTVVCFFQSADKFKTRYCTLGFSDAAKIDQGGMWPTSFAIVELTPADEAMITELVKKAVG